MRLDVVDRWLKSRKYDVLAVGGLALIVRIIYVSQLAATPFFDSPIVDAEYHDAWAREILSQGIGHEGVFFRAPLYPYFLALIYSLSGGSYLAARLAQCLLGTATAILTYLLALSFTKRRAAALIAGFGAASYGMLVYFDGELLVETLFTPLLLAGCLAYVQARKRGELSWHLLVGILLGLAAITRPSALVLLPILAMDALFVTRLPTKEPSLRRRLTHSLVLLIGCFLPIVPVTWHNFYQGGDFVLVASQGGVNAYIGNNSQADGLHSYLPGLGSNWDVPSASHQAYQAESRVLRPSEVSQYYYSLARRFVVNEPLAWAKLTLKKFWALWSRWEISNNRDLYFFKNETAVLPFLRLIGFWIVAPLGLLGWWVGRREKLIPGWFFWSIPAYMLSVIAFFVSARFRIPLVPFLLICAGMALTSLFERRKGIFDRQRVIDFSVLLVLGLFVNTNPWGLHRENPAHSYFSLGNAYLKSGHLEASRQAYRSALEADSTYLQVHLNLGVVSYREGNLEEAAREYQQELELSPSDVRATNNLGIIRFEKGRLDEARMLFQKALDRQPYFDDARINLAQVVFKLGMGKASAGETVAAAEHFAKACALDGEKALYHYNYALALGKLGYAAPAREHLQEALRIKPDFDTARDLLERIETLPSGDAQLPH